MDYEVQTYKNGEWVISSVQDDKDEGIYEAQRLLQNKRTSAVRVVQEFFDESSDTYRMKVVFRRSRKGGEESSSGGAGARGARGGGVREEQDELGEIPFTDRAVAAINKGVAAFLNSVVFLILKFTVIIGLGVWLLVTMNGLVQKL